MMLSVAVLTIIRGLLLTLFFCFKQIHIHSREGKKYFNIKTHHKLNSNVMVVFKKGGGKLDF